MPVHPQNLLESPAAKALLLARTLPKTAVPRNRSQRRLDRKHAGLTRLSGLNRTKSPRPCWTHAPGGLAAVSRRGRVPDMPGDVPHPDRGHVPHRELSYGIRSKPVASFVKNYRPPYI